MPGSGLTEDHLVIHQSQFSGELVEWWVNQMFVADDSEVDKSDHVEVVPDSDLVVNLFLGDDSEVVKDVLATPV
eukprot:10367996-Prorocentrum_lima.AAC.1